MTQSQSSNLPVPVTALKRNKSNQQLAIQRAGDVINKHKPIQHSRKGANKGYTKNGGRFYLTGLAGQVNQTIGPLLDCTTWLFGYLIERKAVCLVPIAR